ncbi:hypothetical protein QBC36DRAFT_243130 [Triangularia setosa]|uniref:Uncharacterized protein n=1 Tax=Triangularia setosa TaxID=2587417 RepID=A0AAN6W3U6_9PEZI|nr:hypothetical protein QBC36DRAFT_243130 [Podospora setosa]
MAQPTASGTLTSAPSIVDRLVLEPQIAEDEGPVVNSMFFSFPDLGDIINTGIGAAAGAITGQKPADIIAALSSIADIVQAARVGTVAIPLDQIVRLAINSPEFYSAVGAVAGAIPAAPPHVIATQAQGVHQDFPSHWYVNFPHVMSGHDTEAVKRNRKSMTDFRSWSSKKWWEEVSRRFGVADEAIQRARQSKQFAEIACEDMVKMSWLRTTRPPNVVKYSIECESHQLHGRLLEKVMSGWSTVDSDLLGTIEPIFQGIVKAALAGSRESSQMKNVVMEKYVYEASTKSITSYIRLLSFEMHEAVYDVIRNGKGGGRQSRVSVDLSLCLYEAVFEAALWEQFSATLHDDETDLLWEYVQGQTIDVRNRQ